MRINIQYNRQSQPHRVTIHDRQVSLRPGSAGSASPQSALGQLQSAKEALVSEHLELVGGQEHTLRLVLNEAEALAWQTEFPHLVFPALATEKIEQLAKWHQNQIAVQGRQVERAFAA